MAIVISWIQEALRIKLTHLLFRDIAIFLQGYSAFIVRYVYREANSAVDWAVSFVVDHSTEVL